MKVRMEQEILQENEYQAEENRRLFRRILTVNLIGSPRMRKNDAFGENPGIACWRISNGGY